MVCLGKELRSFCHFWNCIQVLRFGLCWLGWLLHFFLGILAHSNRYNGYLSSIHPFQSILVRWFLKCQNSLLPSLVWSFPIFLDSWIPINHGKFWKRWTPENLTCFSRNLNAGQEATVRTRHGTTDWFQIGKGAHQGCILSPCLFNFYAEYIMRNAGLEEAQTGNKIAGRNINNLRYADDTTQSMAESEETKEPLV